MRSTLMLNALENLVGTDQCMDFSNQVMCQHVTSIVCVNGSIISVSVQVELVDHLRTVANAVKSVREAHRQTTLIHELQRLLNKFVSTFRLPLDPALLVKGIDVKVRCQYPVNIAAHFYSTMFQACSFFNSNTVPLKISFTNADAFGKSIDIIYKVRPYINFNLVCLYLVAFYFRLVTILDKIFLFFK